MPVPISQAWTVASYVLGQKLRGNKRYPLVLMLEPLFRCNLECAGCGKIQYPEHILKKRLTPQQCFEAVEECGAPMVSIPGGEPLIHPEIKEIVEGLVARKKYIYLCTNAILLKRKLDLFTPSKYLTFSIHMDGLKEDHDHAVCREGIFDVAIEAIREALKRGFRVTTNTTLFEGTNPVRVRAFFDMMMEVGVEGMMMSPGYSYSKAPDQEHFLQRNRTGELFTRILGNSKKEWKFNQSPLFLEFLMGRQDYECTPWGNPTYNIFGWQKPCYLLAEGYAPTFRELLDETVWDRYGRKSGNPKCANCMVHCGYEATAVDDTFGSWRGFLRTIKLTLFGLNASQPLKNGHGHPGVHLNGSSNGYSKDLDAVLNSTIEKAFDYRGSITLELKDGRKMVGYLFNREARSSLHCPEPFVEIMPENSSDKVRVKYSEIAGIAFTGEDMAAGKSWEEWVAKDEARKRSVAKV